MGPPHPLGRLSRLPLIRAASLMLPLPSHVRPRLHPLHSHLRPRVHLRLGLRHSFLSSTPFPVPSPSSSPMSPLLTAPQTDMNEGERTKPRRNHIPLPSPLLSSPLPLFPFPPPSPYAAAFSDTGHPSLSLSFPSARSLRCCLLRHRPPLPLPLPSLRLLPPSFSPLPCPFRSLSLVLSDELSPLSSSPTSLILWFFPLFCYLHFHQPQTTEEVWVGGNLEAEKCGFFYSR
ncbi:hypothetical protein ACLOJK_038012 [Asimina triloba]